MRDKETELAVAQSQASELSASLSKLKRWVLQSKFINIFFSLQPLPMELISHFHTIHILVFSFYLNKSRIKITYLIWGWWDKIKDEIARALRISVTEDKRGGESKKKKEEVWGEEERKGLPILSPSKFCHFFLLSYFRTTKTHYWNACYSGWGLNYHMKNKLVSKINENCWLEEAMVNHVVWTNGIFPLNSSIS